MTIHQMSKFFVIVGEISCWLLVLVIIQYLKHWQNWIIIPLCSNQYAILNHGAFFQVLVAGSLHTSSGMFSDWSRSDLKAISMLHSFHVSTFCTTILISSLIDYLLTSHCLRQVHQIKAGLHRYWIFNSWLYQFCACGARVTVVIFFFFPE